jgi:uncharacterized membrane protein
LTLNLGWAGNSGFHVSRAADPKKDVATAAERAAMVLTAVEVVAAGQMKVTTAAEHEEGMTSAAAEPVTLAEATSVHTLSTSEWLTVVVIPATASFAPANAATMTTMSTVA